MPFRLWFQAPRRVLALFATLTLVPASAVGWLGWWTLRQNRALDRQREVEGLEIVADRIPGALDRALADLQRRLGVASAKRPEDMVLLSAVWISFCRSAAEFPTTAGLRNILNS